ncbi:MAG: hypothetical protein D6689_02090, partial [Deltaproteobacteria bacterium]
MIAYEELVAALTAWRRRNGLPTTPPDYGEPVSVAPAAAGPAAPPDEVYDLSDDSGLIVAEEIGAEDGAFAHADGEADEPAGAYADAADAYAQPDAAYADAADAYAQPDAAYADAADAYAQPDAA